MSGIPRKHAIYVLLTDTGTLFAKLIQSVTSAPYNHASLSLDPGLEALFSFGRKCPTVPWLAGFVKEDVYEGTYALFPNTHCALLRLELSGEQRRTIMQTITSFQAKKDRYRYNIFGLLGVLLQKEIAPANAYFCSQFVAEVLGTAGIRPWPRPPALVTPQDFLVHPDFELVYEGGLFDYLQLTRARTESAFPEWAMDFGGS